MPRKPAILLIAFLAATAGLLAARAGRTRESLLPLLRAGQAHVKQVERAAALAIPVDAMEERNFGRQIAQICGRGARRDARLEEIGKRLEKSAGVKRYAGRYEYRVLPGRRVAGFAVPGGYIFVTQGLLDALEFDRARVAFVLAHEIGHTELGHTADRVRYKAWLRKWHIPGSNLGQALRELAALSFSPGQELEADAFALDLMRRRDYRLEGAVEFFEKSRPRRPEAGGTHRRTAEVLAEGFVDYFRTHPGERERVEKLRGLIGSRAPIAVSTGTYHPIAAPAPSNQDQADFFTGG